MNDTLRALLTATEAMWPAPATVQATHRSRGGAADAADRTPETTVDVGELLLIPNARAPRLVVTHTSTTPRVLAEVLGRTSADTGFVQRATRSALSGLLRTPGSDLLLSRGLPDRIRISAPSGAVIPSLERRLSELLEHEVVLCFGVGSPRANRKPVVQVLTPDGSTVAFAKLGVDEISRELVRGETEALQTFWSSAGPPRRIDAPRVLHAGAWRDLELLVMTPLRPRRRRGDARVPPREAMQELATRFGVHTEVLAETDFWQRIQAVPELEVQAKAVEQSYGHRTLTLGAWHGDWTPWNMAGDTGRVLLWDFERFQQGVPLGFDLAHYRLQRALHTSGEKSAERLLVDGPLVDEPGGELVTTLYLLELARRWVLASAPPVGAPLRARTTWLLDLLGRWL